MTERPDPGSRRSRRAGALLALGVCLGLSAGVGGASRLVGQPFRAVVTGWKACATEPSGDILLADFEGKDYGAWAATGEAFGPGPGGGAIGGQQAVSGFRGKGLVNSFCKGDGAQGTLRSPEFTIERDHVNFLIGGGQHAGRTCVELLVDGKVVRTATGANAERLEWSGWRVAAFRGRRARIRIADRHTTGWGHVNVDHIVQTDRSGWAFRLRAAREAMKADAAGGPWYTTGPLPCRSLDEALWPEKGVDLSARGADGALLWRKRTDWPDGRVHALPGRAGAATYLFRTLTAPRAMRVHLSLGADDGRAVWLGGRKVFSRDAVGPVRRDQDRIVLDLRPGATALLVKIRDAGGDHGFCFRTTLGQGLARGQWGQMRRRFRRECDALEADLGRRHLAWLVGEASARLDARVIGRVLDQCGRRGGDLRRRLDALARAAPPPDEAEWLDLYVEACAVREVARVLGGIESSVAGAGDRAGALRAELDDLTKRNVDLADPRWQALRRKALAGRLGGFGVREIVFALRKVDGDGHWYANFGTWSNNPKRTLYHEGGRLCRLHVKTREVARLIDDPAGGVRDPQLHYGGRKVLVSYRKGGQPFYHLYEINVDGTGLRQLTDGPCDDIEPTYLPDGGIAFCSSRCNRMVNCYFVRVAVVYRCDADGGNIRQLSSNIEHDNTPWPLPDGRILHQRWEYIDRSQVSFHHLWTMNPDGTGQMVYFGNMHGGNVYLDAKPIPGSDKIVLSWSPGHGQREHAGYVTILDPNSGPDHLPSARRLQSVGLWRDPYPLSEDCFLVAGDTDIRVMDSAGQSALLYDLPAGERSAGLKVHEPRPVRPRPRERVIPPQANPARATGRVFLENIHVGRNMSGVRRGEIKKLLVLEALPKPVNFSGAQEPLSMGGTFTLERILGTVPVEPDGSAYIELPAMRSLFFVALDADDLSVKRMQSFLTVQPGETLGCVGCHENRRDTPRSARPVMAMARPPSPIEPIADVPDVIDFPRDVQPILNKHCLACHGHDKTAKGGPRSGGVILSGDRGPWYSLSYVTLTERGQFADGRNGGGNRPPRSIGSSASPLLKKLAGHHGVRASARERRIVRLWIDSAAAYPGTYAALGSGMVRDVCRDAASRRVLQTRCARCHRPGRSSVHRWYNLSRPEKSLALLAPLARAAGGCGMAPKVKKGKPAPAERVEVFPTTADADYRTLLAGIRAAKKRLDAIKRFDMPGFRPNEHYIREMKFYGILPRHLGAGDPIDVYRTDQAYWRSLWYRPPAAGR